MNNSKTSGILLIIIGVIILLYSLDISIFCWEYFRGYGALIIGFLLLMKGNSRPHKKGLFLGSFIFLIGIYYTLGLTQFYSISRGLSIGVFTIALGISFYSLFFFKRRDWGYLLFGNFIIIIGLFFLLEYMKKLPSYLLIDTVDQFWPLLLIVFGLILLMKPLTRREY